MTVIASTSAISQTHTAGQRPSVSPLTLFHSLCTNRQLIWQMTKREVVGRYRGSVFGLLWSFFNPLLMLAVYTFAFGFVFKARWPHQSNPMDFAINVFAGLILFTLFSETINRAPTLILSNVSYVKKVVFPLEILPWITVFSALIHAAISTGVLLLAVLVLQHTLCWTVVFLPIVLLPLILMTIGFACFLASLGVYLRDLAQSINIVTMVTMYLCPIFYSRNPSVNPNMPPWVMSALSLNPLTVPVENLRLILIPGDANARYGSLPDFTALGIYALASLVVAWLGFAWFQRTKRGFADVL